MANPHIDEYGNKLWCNSVGQLHREDGPAIEWADGEESWHINGIPIIDTYGSKIWRNSYGQIHREDGPAIEWIDGTKLWYIKGNDITEEANQWIIDNNFPKYEEWDDNIKVLFKLKFG